MSSEPMPPRVLVRRYRGRTQNDVVSSYQADAAALALEGYLPVTQSWAYGQWSTAVVFIAVILCLFLVGFVLVALMVVTKPDGDLLVTYVRHD